MIFADYAELETAKSQLKNELKSQVTNVFDELFERCYFKAYDTLVLRLDSIEHAFLKFTKGHKKEWCDKTSLLYTKQRRIYILKTCTIILTTSLRNGSCSMKSGLCAQNASKL